MTPTELLVKLEVRRMNTLAAEHRLAKQRRAMEHALTRLRMGVDTPACLLPWLAERGVAIKDTKAATEGTVTASVQDA